MAERAAVPRRLAAAGRRLWDEVTPVYDLRPDELVLLEKAARTADEAARLDAAARDAPLLVTGSMGQQRVNPLFAEARATRALLAALLRQLALPDEDTNEASDASWLARQAARARWEGRRSHGA